MEVRAGSKRLHQDVDGSVWPGDRALNIEGWLAAFRCEAKVGMLKRGGGMAERLRLSRCRGVRLEAVLLRANGSF
jgi:hypothetical protein